MVNRTIICLEMPSFLYFQCDTSVAQKPCLFTLIEVHFSSHSFWKLQREGCLLGPVDLISTVC